MAKKKKLAGVIARDTKDMQASAEFLFMEAWSRVEDILENLRKEVMAVIAASLSRDDTISYQAITKANRLDRLEDVLKRAVDSAAGDIVDLWSEFQGYYDIYGRLFAGFVARKTQPPWMPVKVDLKSKVEVKDGFDPCVGHVHAYLRALADQIVAEIRKAALAEESFSALLQRVRKVLSIGAGAPRPRTREADKKGSNVPLKDENDRWKIDMNFPAGLTVSEGVYTVEDAEDFVQTLRSSMNWKYRAPGKTKAQGEKNEWLRKLEHLLAYDAVSQLHEGTLQIGSKAMGIEDFEWVTSGPHVCDFCAKRDGKTMTEIRAEIKDEYKDTPPPLHPRCNCQLVPKIKDDWSRSEVEKAGYEWNPDDGIVYRADRQEKSFGYTDMTFDEYLQQIGVRR